MPGPVVLFLVVSIVTIAVAVAVIVSRAVKLQFDFNVEGPGTDFRSLMQFTKEKHERIGEYMRANWSGTPEHLPQVLGSLLSELERDAKTRGLTIDRDMLKSIVATSIRAHRIGRNNDLQQALTRVA